MNSLDFERTIQSNARKASEQAHEKEAAAEEVLGGTGRGKSHFLLKPKEVFEVEEAARDREREEREKQALEEYRRIKEKGSAVEKEDDDDGSEKDKKH